MPFGAATRLSILVPTPTAPIGGNHVNRSSSGASYSLPSFVCFVVQVVFAKGEHYFELRQEFVTYAMTTGYHARPADHLLYAPGNELPGERRTLPRC
jgi:hypothetical protein